MEALKANETALKNADFYRMQWMDSGRFTCYCSKEMKQNILLYAIPIFTLYEEICFNNNPKTHE